MTYPDPFYTASEAEITATITRAGAEPDLVRTSGTEVHYLATGDTTDGLFGLYRWSMGPGRGGASPHFHRTMAESFYILTGTVRVFDGEEWVDAEVGDFAPRPTGRDPRLQQRVWRAGVDAHPLRSRGAARAVLRGSQRLGRDVRGGAGRLLPRSRQPFLD